MVNCITGTARKLGGTISGVILLFWILLIDRQYEMWSLTRDGYYLVSTGVYLAIGLAFFAGVVWGLTSALSSEAVTLAMQPLSCGPLSPVKKQPEPGEGPTSRMTVRLLTSS
jgi:hypothetical protein